MLGSVYGLWITLGIMLAGALLARRVPRRPPWLGHGLYLVGLWVLNEVPQWAAVWVVASVAFATLHGDLTLASPEGVVALLVAAVTVALLAGLLRRSLRAPSVLAEALHDQLGVAVRTRPVSSLRALVPFPRRSRGVRHLRDLSYGPHGRRNRLDVYLPESGATRGVFVHFHGGHFRIGRKDTQSLPLLHHLARAGWMCISANYRLEPKAGYPDYVVDAKAAIAWAREHAVDHGADPDLVVAAGDSAGGYLALFAAMTPNDPGYQPGFEGAATEVAAAVGLYGYYGRTADDPASTPLAHRPARVPPLLLVHGDQDSEAPVEWVRRVVPELREAAGEPVVYAELPGAHHSFTYLHSWRSDAFSRSVAAFLQWVAEHRPPSPERPS